MSKNTILIDTVYDPNLDVFREECNAKLKLYGDAGRLIDIMVVTPLCGGFAAVILYWDKAPVNTTIEQPKPKDPKVGRH